MLTVRISIPPQASVGEIIEIKTLATHPMESGFRRDSLGQAIPQDILTEFTCYFNNKVIFRAHFKPGVAANPYLTFHHRVTEEGQYRLEWLDQQGAVTEQTRSLRIAPSK